MKIVSFLLQNTNFIYQLELVETIELQRHNFEKNTTNNTLLNILIACLSNNLYSWIQIRIYLYIKNL